MRSKWFSIVILAICQIAAMAVWFSASAVVAQLAEQYRLSAVAQSLLTTSVQLGFVIGGLTSAALGLADRFDPQRFFAVSALFAATANALLIVIEPTSAWVPVLRFATGAAMAGIYPVGMKLAATWAAGDLGLMVGLLVGALTLGSATPYLYAAIGGISWRFTLASSSASTLLAALLINFVSLGPNRGMRFRFEPQAALLAWKLIPLRLANLGYLGHMWELYAMWAWVGVFLQASFALRMEPSQAALAAKLAAFATIAIGAVGCVAGGLVADRLGRTTLTMLAMATSGSCSAAVGFFYGGDPALLTALCLVWGVAIVADSAQFSAAVAELSDRSLIGTMLTLQTALGFTLTLLTIHLMPMLVDAVGWRYAFIPLALGPFFGVWAMARLRARPESLRLAGGRG